jgi:hypothetical protein
MDKGDNPSLELLEKLAVELRTKARGRKPFPSEKSVESLLNDLRYKNQYRIASEYIKRTRNHNIKGDNLQYLADTNGISRNTVLKYYYRWGPVILYFEGLEKCDLTELDNLVNKINKAHNHNFLDDFCESAESAECN